MAGVGVSPCNERGTAVARRCLEQGGSFEECLAVEFLHQWRSDARKIARLWTEQDASVLWVTTPAAVGARARSGPIAPVYREVAQEFDQVLVDAARALRANDGTWPTTLPCLPREGAPEGCVDGQIIVRRSVEDGHLCPVAPPPGTELACPVYSSGIVRWAGAVSMAARRAMR